MSRDAPEREIEEILGGVRVGERRSTNQLYARLWPLVFGYCYHRLRPTGSAEEAAQDAMLEIMQRSSDIRAPAAVWSYARLVAAKHCDRRTRRKRLGTVPAADLPDDRRGDPLSQFLEQEERRDVAEALWSLSPRLRVVLVLYYVHSFRTGEIAAFLGTSVEAVKKRLSDGRKKLKGRMAMVEGVLRDFGGLVKIGNRSVQKLLRELGDEDLGRVLHVVAPEVRDKLERNVSGRVLARLRAVPRDDEKSKEAVERFWRTLDRMLEVGEMDLVPREDSPGAAAPVPSMATGPGQGDRAAWLRQVLRELSLKARQHGLFSLEHDAEQCRDVLLREGLQAVVDGIPPEAIRARLRAHGRGDTEALVEEGILAIQLGRAPG